MQLINRYQYIFGLAVVISLFSACTTDITLDLPAPEPKIVVEGTIEPGLPPIISLTSTVPFYGEVNFNELDAFYVHDATVTVSDGVNSVELVEFCLDDIPEELLPLVAAFLGFELDSTGTFAVNFCLYTVPDIFAGTPAFVGEVGKTYSLNISYEDKVLTSSTTLYPPVPPDSIYYVPDMNPDVDSLVRLYIALTEPEPQGNFYRYFTKQNEDAFYPGFSSVFDDNLINGQSFSFTVDRGYNPTEDFSINPYGVFKVGDTIILKWCSIDFPTYDFYRTLEFDSGTDGPFSSATIVQTNINGGLGIWCAYGSVYDTLIVQ